MKLRLSTLTLALAAATVLLLLPATQADAAGGPFDLTNNHYKCYRVIEHEFQGFPVQLVDQFGQSQSNVLRPRYVCNPVSKNGEPVPEPEVHQVCYEIIQISSGAKHKVEVRNQFGPQVMVVQFAELLCLPSTKREIF